MIKCPLCLNDNYIQILENKSKIFYKCQTCKLIFVDSNNLLSSKDEKSIYNLHENDPNDLRYREFMERILTPLREYLPEKAHGIDFGCGPGPVVASILSKEGYKVDEYDPFYADNRFLLDLQYNFIVCTEVMEHIYETKNDFELMLSLLREGGVMALMTSFYPSDIDKFRRWGYHGDPTHVRFFNEETFEWMAKEYGLKLIIPRKNIGFFIKE